MPSGGTSQSRQLPGLACEECRKRKLRCDRQRPQCRLCSELGIQCVLNLDRPPRGPKKGYSRNPQTKKAPSVSSTPPGQSQDNDIIVSSSDNSNQTDGDEINMATESLAGLHDPKSSQLPHISRLMQADLHHLYFDRIHALVPMIQQQKYCTNANNDTKTEPQVCLQYAMWTLATTVTSQFNDIRDSLYRATKVLVTQLENKSSQPSNVPIELVQVWILLTVYEFIQRNYQQGWMSAGHTFRLVQLLRLHEIDKPGGPSYHMPSPSPILSTSSMSSSSSFSSSSSLSIDLGIFGQSSEWVQREEMRRTFWIAYCLDRFPSMCNNLPMTFNEQTICCRLPVPEDAFQKSQPVVECFLSEGLTMNGPVSSNLSSLSHFILLATVCGRTVDHGQQCTVEQIYGDALQGFLARHEWLDTVLNQQIHAISLVSRPMDPLFLFSHMMAQSTILKLYKILQSNLACLQDFHSVILLEYQQRAMAAADEIVCYAANLDQLNIFKVHPFTPFAIYLCADFFRKNTDLDATFEIQYLEMRQVLRDLASTNHLADYCADLLTSESSMSDIATWTGCSQDGNGVIDTATLLAMDEFEITSPDLILE